VRPLAGARRRPAARREGFGAPRRHALASWRRVTPPRASLPGHGARTSGRTGQGRPVGSRERPR